MHDRIIPRPFSIDKNLSENVFRHGSHGGDLLDFLFGNFSVLDDGLGDDAVRVADENIAGFAVAFGGEFDAVFHRHPHNALDHRNAVAGKLAVVFEPEFAEYFINYFLPLLIAFFVNILDIFEREPRIVGFRVRYFDMFGKQERVLVAQIRFRSKFL